jgi:hypothetical protein
MLRTQNREKEMVMYKSKLLAYAIGNPLHSEVIDRDGYRGTIHSVLAGLRGAPIPITTSFHRLGRHLFGITDADFGGSLQHVDTTAAHTLVNLYGEELATRKLCQRILDEGVKGNAGEVLFPPEFDIPGADYIIRGNPIVPIAPYPNTVSYYGEADGDISFGAPLSRHEAVQYGNMTVVHMSGRMEGTQRGSFLLSAFLEWQRFPLDGRRRDRLAEEIRKHLESAEERTFIFYIDLECCLVGSHHGFDIWQMFFDLLREYGLTDGFTSFSAESARWREIARNCQDAPNFVIERETGHKWTRWPRQNRLIARVKAAVRGWDGDPEVLYRLFLLASSADSLSGMFRKICEEVGTIVRLPADRGPIEIRSDQRVIDMALAALAGIETGDVQVAADMLQQQGTAVATAGAEFLITGF